MKSSLPGGLLAALLAASPLFSPDEARAQAPVCTPTQRVVGSAAVVVDPNAEVATPLSRFTTVLVCADTTAAAGAADYRHLHYNQGPGGTSATVNPEDRDRSLPGNFPTNDVSLTIGSGVVFTADGGVDMRLVEVDGAIALWRGGAKTVVVEDGAVINYERRPGGGQGFYGNFRHFLSNHAGIYAVSETGKGGVTVRHHGVIDIDFEIQGGWGPLYDATVGSAITAVVRSGPTRGDEDILVELGATGVIRHRAGSDGINGIYAQNGAEDGDTTVHLAEGSLIDVTPGGGVAVTALVGGTRAADVVVRAAGTIRAAVKGRTIALRQGVSLRAVNSGLGAIRVTSSGTVESWQALAIHATANSADGEQHDDPATEGIEGHLIDVTAGKVHTRGGTAIHAESYSADSAFTIRVGEGATVRAEFEAGPDAVTQAQLGTDGGRYVFPNNNYGWRLVDTDNDGTDDALEPVVNAIRVVGRATSEGVADRVIVHGTVEAVGGKADVDPAILMNDGGVVVVGATGRVVADSGLAIASGNTPGAGDDPPPASDLRVTVRGRVEGDIRVRDAGDLHVIMAGGTVVGDLGATSASDLRVTVLGRVEGGLRLLDAGNLYVTIADARVEGGIRVPSGSDLRLTVRGKVGDVGVLDAGNVIVTVDGSFEGDVTTDGRPMVVVRGGRDGVVGAVKGRIGGAVGDPVAVVYQPPGGGVARSVTAPLGTPAATPAGARDLGVVAENGAVRVESGYAPRARVYEALPSVLLGLNRLPEFRDRMSAPRSANGGWARVEASHDKWKADGSTSSSRLEYTHRRRGLKAGVDAMLGEHGLFGVSLHHRRGKAKVSDGGEIDVSGHGLGFSGTWGRAGAGEAGVYADVQAERTWYEADFRSSLRGGLKTDVSGRGHALGVEVGRRYEAGGMLVTPRARLAHSRVTMDFTDAVGSRVSVEEGRSLRGRVGLVVETRPGGASGNRVAGTLDVEREFSRGTKAVVSGADLKSQAESTWLRLGLDGSHTWGDDERRYTVEGGVNYATSGDGSELGGGLNLKMRF